MNPSKSKPRNANECNYRETCILFLTENNSFSNFKQVPCWRKTTLPLQNAIKDNTMRIGMVSN